MKNSQRKIRKSQAMVEYAVLTTFVVIAAISFLYWGNWLPYLRKFVQMVLYNIAIPIP